MEGEQYVIYGLYIVYILYIYCIYLYLYIYGISFVYTALR